MMLVAAGDSFTYGLELVPPGFATNSRGAIEPPPSVADKRAINLFRLSHAWPSILRYKLGFDGCINLGRAGLSNDQISSAVMDWMDANAGSIDPDGTMLIVGWTSPGRISYYDERTSEWKTCFPSYRDDDRVSSFYYQNMHSEVESYQRYWKNLLLVQGMAASLGIRCVMFNAFQPAPLMDGTIGYSNLVDRSSLCFDVDMLKYCKEQGCRIAPGRHPAAEGHQTWAEYLDRWIRSNPSVIPPRLRLA